MATVIRAIISENNKYWIDKHRHYELKHFCLQYPMWKKAYRECLDRDISLAMIDGVRTIDGPYDPTATRAVTRAYYGERIKLVERAAREADEYLWHYIVKGVTEGYSYTYLRSKLDIPCGKDTYYKLYRKFFYLLSQYRD